MTLENTGNVKWEAGGALTSSPSLGLTCSADTAATVHDTAANNFAMDHILLVGHKVTCTGNFTFTQAVYEGVTGGAKTFTVSLPSSRPTTDSGWQYLDDANAAKESQSVDVPATVIRSMAGTTIATPCTKPANASGEWSLVWCGAAWRAGHAYAHAHATAPARTVCSRLKFADQQLWAGRQSMWSGSSKHQRRELR